MLKKKGIYSLLEYIALLELKGRDFKVLLYILRKVNSDDFIKINQKVIAEELSLSKSEVSKAIKHLIQNDILILNQDSENKRKKVELKLRDYSVDDLDSLIFELVVKNSQTEI